MNEKTNLVDTALTVGRTEGYTFQTDTHVGTLAKPICEDGWWYVPTDINSKQIQPARKQIDTLISAGVPILQIVVAHEPPLRQQLFKYEVYDWDQMMADKTMVVLKVLAKITYELLKITAQVAVFMLKVALVIGGVFLAAAASALCGSDPICYAVLGTGEWVEVARW